MGDPSQLLGERLVALDEIRVSCQVYIDFVGSKARFQLQTDSPGSIEKCLASIRSVIRNAQAEASAAAPLYIVQTPESRVSSVVGLPTEATKRSEIPVIQGFRLIFGPSEDAEAQNWQETRSELQTYSMKKHFDYIKSSLKKLKDLNNWMRMRVHFGNFELTRYQKTFVREGSHMWENFLCMMEDFRTVGNFEKGLGDIAEAASIVKRIDVSQSLFEPEDPMLSCPAEILPKHSLVIFVKTPAGDSVRLDTGLDLLSTCPGSGIYQWGETQYYQASKHKTRSDVITCALENKYSWRHEIITNDVLTDIPKTLKDFVSANSMPSKATHRTDEHGFTYPTPNITVSTGIHIETVVVRTSMKYLITSSAYAFELAVYRTWNGSQLKDIPAASSFGMSIYGVGWDAEMAQSSLITGSRSWDSEMDNFFLEVDNGGTAGFAEFLTTVEKIQDFLNMN